MLLYLYSKWLYVCMYVIISYVLEFKYPLLAKHWLIDYWLYTYNWPGPFFLAISNNIVGVINQKFHIAGW